MRQRCGRTTAIQGSHTMSHFLVVIYGQVPVVLNISKLPALAVKRARKVRVVHGTVTAFQGRDTAEIGISVIDPALATGPGDLYSRLYGRGRTRTDADGRGRTRTDADGRGRTRTDADGHFFIYFFYFYLFFGIHRSVANMGLVSVYRRVL